MLSFTAVNDKQEKDKGGEMRMLKIQLRYNNKRVENAMANRSLWYQLITLLISIKNYD